MKIEQLSLLLVFIVFLNFCSLMEEKPPRSVPESPATTVTQTEPDNSGNVPVKNSEETANDMPQVAVETTPTLGPVITEQVVFQTGIASWYGPDFNGKRTANGEIYDMNKLTAAHKDLAFHTLVEVENIDTRQKVVVRINDRGPFVKDRIIDLSKKAAKKVGMFNAGTALVQLRILKANHVRMNKQNGTYAENNTPSNSTPNLKPRPIETDTEHASNENHAPEPLLQKEVIDESPIANPLTSAPAVPDTTPAELSSDLPNHTDQGQKFILQAGAFSGKKNADRHVSHLKDVVPFVNFEVRRQGNLFRVVSYPVHSREEADTLKKLLKENGFDSLIKKDSD